VTRVLAFGDSLTAGTTAPPLMFRTIDAGLPVSYPYRLQTLLGERYTSQTILVFNAGFAGIYADDDHGRLGREIRETQAEVVLLMHGANDLNRDGRAGIGQMIGALEELIDEGIDAGLPVFVATLPPQRLNSSRGGAASFLSEVNAQLRRMASDEGATVVDLNGRMTLSDIGQDGLHPTEDGYRHMAEIWLEALKTAYETAPAAARRVF
jgi:lysophospholipase L1-like esterase